MTFPTYPDLHGRTVIITGGASGIGEAFVHGFVANDAKVAFLDIQPDAGNALQSATGARFVQCDLTDLDALKDAIAAIGKDLGPVSVLVNNAANDLRQDFESVTPSEFDWMMAVNFRHVYFAAQAVLPQMREFGRGSIINMSSGAWMGGGPRMQAYSAAKAAIVGFTNSLARDVGKDNIRVNAILPGAIVTERQRRLWLTPEYEAEILAAQALKRLILPEEVARLALFLAADDSAAITSQSCVIDGGWV